MDNLPKERESSTPGIGVAGMVMCPFFKGACLKHACEIWVELTYDKGLETERKVGRCSMAWIPLLSTETRAAIDRLYKNE